MTPSLKLSDKVDMSGLVFFSCSNRSTQKITSWSKGEIRMKEFTCVSILTIHLLNNRNLRIRLNFVKASITQEANENKYKLQGYENTCLQKLCSHIH